LEIITKKKPCKHPEKLLLSNLMFRIKPGTLIPPNGLTFANHPAALCLLFCYNALRCKKDNPLLTSTKHENNNHNPRLIKVFCFIFWTNTKWYDGLKKIMLILILILLIIIILIIIIIIIIILTKYRTNENYTIKSSF